MLALALALVTQLAQAQPEVVRVQARPELPWVVAVAALDVDVPRADLDKALAAAAGTLDDVGAAARVELLAGRAAIVVEGPPEAHDVIVSTARTVAATTGAPTVLFLDGRTTLSSQGALPRRSRGSSAASTSKASRHSGKPAMPLAPGPGLLDVEGEALALLVERAIAADVGVDVADGRAALVVEGSSGALDNARAALEGAVATPLPGRVLDDLRTRARGRVAERRGRAGGWARDMATMWLAFGTIDVDEPAELGSALRARVFPAVLLRAAPATGAGSPRP